MNGAVGAFILTGVLVVSLVWILRHRTVPVTVSKITATLPWFVVIGVLVALGRVLPLSEPIAVLLGSPTVYLFVTALVAGLWITLDALDVVHPSQWTAASGTLTAIAVVLVGLPHVESLSMTVLVWNGVAIGLALGLTAFTLRTVPNRLGFDHGYLGRWVLFAHVLDGTTTGVGLEQLGMTERNPLSAWIIQAGEGIGLSGVGLFVLVKIVVALLILVFLDPDSETPDRGTVTLLIGATGAGLVPAVHNLVVFTLTAY